MKSRLASICIFMLILTSTISAQMTWAPLGAEWHYSLTGMTLQGGYSRIESVSDTTIDDISCKKLVETRYVTEGGDVYSYTASILYMYADEDRIYIHNGTSFVTLYDFSLIVGDTYQIDYHPICDASAVLQVDAVGTTNINEMELRYYDVTTISSDSYFFSGRIYERIGSDYFMVGNPGCPEGIDGIWGGPIRCYGDSELGSYSTGEFENCEFITSLEELENPLQFYPNPVRDGFAIKTSYSSGVIRIHDMTGHLILEQQFSSIVNISSLASGIYTLQIASGSSTDQRVLIKL